MEQIQAKVHAIHKWWLDKNDRLEQIPVQERIQDFVEEWDNVKFN